MHEPDLLAGTLSGPLRIRKLVTNQVTTAQATPDGARRAQTPISSWPVVIRLNAMPSEEIAIHGKEKVYGSIP